MRTAVAQVSASKRVASAALSASEATASIHRRLTLGLVALRHRKVTIQLTSPRRFSKVLRTALSLAVQALAVRTAAVQEEVSKQAVQVAPIALRRSILNHSKQVARVAHVAFRHSTLNHLVGTSRRAQTTFLLFTRPARPPCRSPPRHPSLSRQARGALGTLRSLTDLSTTNYAMGFQAGCSCCR